MAERTPSPNSRSSAAADRSTGKEEVDGGASTGGAATAPLRCMPTAASRSRALPRCMATLSSWRQRSRALRATTEGSMDLRASGSTARWRRNGAPGRRARAHPMTCGVGATRARARAARSERAHARARASQAGGARSLRGRRGARERRLRSRAAHIEMRARASIWRARAPPSIWRARARPSARDSKWRARAPYRSACARRGPGVAASGPRCRFGPPLASSMRPLSRPPCPPSIRAASLGDLGRARPPPPERRRSRICPRVALRERLRRRRVCSTGGWRAGPRGARRDWRRNWLCHARGFSAPRLSILFEKTHRCVDVCHSVKEGERAAWGSAPTDNKTGLRAHPSTGRAPRIGRFWP